MHTASLVVLHLINTNTIFSVTTILLKFADYGLASYNIGRLSCLDNAVTSKTIVGKF